MDALGQLRPPCAYLAGDENITIHLAELIGPPPDGAHGSGAAVGLQRAFFLRQAALGGLPVFPLRRGNGCVALQNRGAYVLNIEDIRTTILERNTAIAAAERKYRESSERSLPEEEGSLQTYGSSAAMRAVRRRAYKLSQMDCNIFITGEVGTGRTKLAKSIQQVQPRGGPFLRTDCSCLLYTS